MTALCLDEDGGKGSIVTGVVEDPGPTNTTVNDVVDYTRSSSPRTTRHKSGAIKFPANRLRSADYKKRTYYLRGHFIATRLAFAPLPVATTTNCVPLFVR